ncbi:SOS response-associated peptidase [Rubellimicrobium roseum]|uniref:Abasic site processing protein n=1 Tax=Rubellimicrobium roseum TaxID=687525 RepID=A0A5C4NCD7_9RHOB|nr:SOS response-associated peptidase [Rubellimicrobium roseum]TNC71555.1 SOS response-associated peptidase [Rubellimicrobium roseum]
MCGRMVMTLPHDAMAQLFAASPANDMPEVPNYNVCPTQAIAVCTAEEGRRLYRPMRWGLIPHWYKAPNDGPLLINARSETVAEKPAFRTAIRERRCLVPATGFYEWDRSDPKKPLPWFVTRADGRPMVFAALWQDWGQGEERISTCAVVTCDANADLSRIHHRLPVILEPEDWALWLGEEGKGAARLMRPIAEGALTLVRVGTEINSSRATGEGLIVPVPLNPA